MKMQNPQPGTAKGIQKIDKKYKNLIAPNYSSFCTFPQSPKINNAGLGLAGAIRDRRLTDAVEMLEKRGYYGDSALFMLAYVGGEINE